jgi:hypothetical protein
MAEIAGPWGPGTPPASTGEMGLGAEACTIPSLGAKILGKAPRRALPFPWGRLF